MPGGFQFYSVKATNGNADSVVCQVKCNSLIQARVEQHAILNPMLLCLVLFNLTPFFLGAVGRLRRDVWLLGVHGELSN